MISHIFQLEPYFPTFTQTAKQSGFWEMLVNNVASVHTPLITFTRKISRNTFINTKFGKPIKILEVKIS